MKDLYEYDSATKAECMEDLEYTINVFDIYDDLDTLERRAIRITNIVNRLKEL